MDVFSYQDYKPLLKDRIKEIRQRKKNWSFKKLADHLKIQSTYLSKIINSDKHHLSEEDLWLACKTLDFHPEEQDYILLLRSHTTCQKSERRQLLAQKIESLQAERKLQAEARQMSASSLTNEMDYLLNPLCVLLYVALGSEHLRKDIRQIGSSLGVRIPLLRDLLRILERNSLVGLDPTDPLRVTKVHSRRTHIPKDHPLMRTHQGLFKNMMQSRLAMTPEEEKQSLLATFTMDERGFEDLKKEFNVFLKKAEEISKKSTHQNVFQINFDLFKWI